MKKKKSSICLLYTSTEYDTKLQEEKNSVSYDVLEMSGSRAVWKEAVSYTQLDVYKRQEGNNVLVVDAVCDTFICNDTVITSELTVKFNDDKSFKYMGNKILNNGTKRCV